MASGGRLPLLSVRSVEALGSELFAVGGTGDMRPRGFIHARAYFDAAILVSADGTSWELMGGPDDLFGPESEQIISCIVAVEAGFVAMGFDEWVDGLSVNRGGVWIMYDGPEAAAVWVSPDGRNWSRVPHNEDLFSRGRIRDAAVLGDTLVAVGGDDIWIATLIDD